jgi:predicted transcriptional regulator
MTVQNLLFLLEKVLSWPVATFVTVLIFRRPLLGLLNRLIALRIGKYLFFLDAPLSVIQSEKPIHKGLETRTSLVEQFKYDESPIVCRREELIRQDLQKLQLDTNQQEAITILVRHLAITQLYLYAEQVYRTIFGSQIALLKQLNIALSITRDQIESFYEMAKAQFPVVYATYSFEQYIHYLQSWNLVSTQDNKQYAITDEGKAFLQWIVLVGAVENKLL